MGAVSGRPDGRRVLPVVDEGLADVLGEVGVLEVDDAEGLLQSQWVGHLDAHLDVVDQLERRRDVRTGAGSVVVVGRQSVVVLLVGRFGEVLEEVWPDQQ